MQGKKNSNKVEGEEKKKVLAHQFSEPAVRGDISLVHFVNKEIVCSESGWVQLIRTERKKKHAKTRKSAQSFFIKSFPVPNYRHCGYWRDEREGGCPSSILSPYQSSTLHLLPPADVASPAHVPLSCSESRKSCRSAFTSTGQEARNLRKGNHPRNDSCHFP